MSNYYVIAFTDEDIGENRDVWFDLWFETALLNTRKQLQSDPLPEHEAIHVDVRRYMPSISLPILAEYKKYSKVYFLNDGAMRLYRNEGVDTAVLKTISEESLPEGLIICFQGPYLPIDR